jgi:integrase
LREKRPGVWEIRIFTGSDDRGKPTQVSRTVRGTKREAQRVMAALESRPAAHAAGRTVADVITAWRETNEYVWSEATRRDYASRAAQIDKDQIARIAVARLGVADVEQWHARMRKRRVGEAAIRCRHVVLRAALSQAVRWEWVPANVASRATLRAARKTPREAMTLEDVRAVLAAAREIDRAAELALRIAAVAGARRAEIAALRWTDFDGERLTIDRSVEVRRDADNKGAPGLVEAPTKTANRRSVMLDAVTATMIDEQRAEREVASPFMFSLAEGPPNPDRIGWWWQRSRTLSGIDKRWRLHDLRHWSATIGITSGHDVRTVAGRLGHSNPATTLRVYAHAVKSADTALATMLGDLLTGEVADSD